MTTILTDDQLRQRAPSIFAASPWQEVSERYTFIPTSDIVAKLRTEGFAPVAARQSVSRIEGKGAFTKHVIRFRSLNESHLAAKVNDLIPEIVLGDIRNARALLAELEGDKPCRDERK